MNSAENLISTIRISNLQNNTVRGVVMDMTSRDQECQKPWPPSIPESSMEWDASDSSKLCERCISFAGPTAWSSLPSQDIVNHAPLHLRIYGAI